MSDANTSDLLGHVLVQVEQLTRRAEASEAALRAERARSEQEVRDLAARNEQMLREQAARNEQVLQEQASRLRQATEEREAGLRKEFQALKTENESLRRVPAALKALESDVGGLREGYSQLWRQQRQPPESEEQVRQRRKAELQAEKEFALASAGRCQAHVHVDREGSTKLIDLNGGQHTWVDVDAFTARCSNQMEVQKKYGETRTQGCAHNPNANSSRPSDWHQGKPFTWRANPRSY